VPVEICRPVVGRGVPQEARRGEAAGRRLWIHFLGGFNKGLLLLFSYLRFLIVSWVRINKSAISHLVCFLMYKMILSVRKCSDNKYLQIVSSSKYERLILTRNYGADRRICAILFSKISELMSSIIWNITRSHDLGKRRWQIL
jgi:hypothetical protein